MKDTDNKTKNLQHLQNAIDELKVIFFSTKDSGIIYLQMASDSNFDENLMYDKISNIDDKELADRINVQLKAIRTACSDEKAQQLIHKEIENLVKLKATEDVASGSNHFRNLLNSASKTGGISK